MEAVITGDIIGSTKISPENWLPVLKAALKTWGKEPADWEIYRGDSFQLKISNPMQAIEAAVYIKAAIKTILELDVRLGIGLGEINYTAKKITESNGTAFIHSGEVFEQLSKMNQEMAIKSPWDQFDMEMNLMLKLALIPMNQWTVSAAIAVWEVLKKPDLTQKELGAKLGITQHAVSARLSRAHMEVIQEWMAYYPIKLKTYL
ncbi:transcriptional regulator [Lunatibacter salilacus]|uniref:transcriptional regulator n=1 Tax=Lunatibacter salilacus TaxID=2483804 RepID=UPI00131E8971|nr:transcriptional regulator [Lunatibacter salilacus]